MSQRHARRSARWNERIPAIEKERDRAVGAASRRRAAAPGVHRGHGSAHLSPLLLVLLLALALLPMHPLPADPIPPFTCSEPNDGELLGTLLLLHFQSPLPNGHRVALSLGGQTLAVAHLSGGACAISIDTSGLPNGAVVFEARLLTVSGSTLATIPVPRLISRPSTVVVDTAEDADGVSQVSLGVGADWASDASVPYVLLAASAVGSGEFEEFGVELPLPPASTVIAASGTLPFDADGMAILLASLDGIATPSGSGLRLQILLSRDGKWVAGPALELPPTP